MITSTNSEALANFIVLVSFGSVSKTMKNQRFFMVFETLGAPRKVPWGSLGVPLGPLGDPLGALGHPLGSHGGPLGVPRGSLRGPLGSLRSP